MKARIVHLNIPHDDTKTRCGLELRKVVWTLHPADVTCGNCKRFDRFDRA